MFCGNCGSKLRDGSPFCVVCGADVADMENIPSTEESTDNASINESNSNKIQREEIQRQEVENSETPNRKVRNQQVENRETRRYEEQQNVKHVTQDRIESRDEYIEEFTICPKCGKRVVKGSRFCNGCGKTL